jgi:hypothetical protein
MTDTPPPAESDAIEAAMDVIVHAIACSESFGPQDMRAAIAAYRAAQHLGPLEAAATAVYDHPMQSGDPLGVLLHESVYIDDSPTIAEQLAAVRELCAGIARSAVAAHVAALPSEFGELKEWLATHNDSLFSRRVFADALAAITALEARIADAISVLKGYEQWEGALILDNNAWTAVNGLPRVPQVHWDRLMELQSRRNAVVRGAAHEAAEKMANG